MAEFLVAKGAIWRDMLLAEALVMFITSVKRTLLPLGLSRFSHSNLINGNLGFEVTGLLSPRTQDCSTTKIRPQLKILGAWKSPRFEKVHKN